MIRKARIRRPSPGTVLGGLALIVAVSGVAVAAIPGGDGTVTACVSKDGEVRVIDADAGTTCKGSQTTVKLASTDATGKVANADMLDGLDSTAFSRLSIPVETHGEMPTSPGFHTLLEARDAAPASPSLAFASVLMLGDPGGSGETVRCLLARTRDGHTVQILGEEEKTLNRRAFLNMFALSNAAGDLSVQCSVEGLVRLVEYRVSLTTVD